MSAVYFLEGNFLMVWFFKSDKWLLLLILFLLPIAGLSTTGHVGKAIFALRYIQILFIISSFCLSFRRQSPCDVFLLGALAALALLTDIVRDSTFTFATSGLIFYFILLFVIL